MNSDLSATVPDIFAATGNDDEIPSEFCQMQLENAGSIKFPGEWIKQTKNQIARDTCYKRIDSISTLVSIGPLQLDQRGEAFVRGLAASGARTLQDFELAGLLAVLSETRRPDEYEITAGSTELLCDRIVLVLQGDFKKEAMREALIIFATGNTIGHGHLSLKAIKPEYAIYFNHLRHALKTIEWSN